MARMNNDRILDLVAQHRQAAINAEQAWKERFYDWELMYFMKYKRSDLAFHKDDQTQVTRSKQYIGYAHAQIETATAKALNGLWGQWPPFQTFPEGGQTFEDAEMIRALHAHSFRLDKMYRKTRQALRFTYMYGTCIWKHLWDRRWVHEMEQIPEPIGVGEDGNLVWGFRTVRTPELVYEGPTSLICDPYCVRADPMADDVESARWMQEDFIRSAEYIQAKIKEGVYRAVKLKEVTPHSNAADAQNYRQRRKEALGVPDQTMSDETGDELQPLMYDITEEWHDDRRITVVGAPGGTRAVLREGPNPHQHGRKPYTIWRYVDLPNEFWGIPMSRQLEGPQSELNLIRRMRSEAMLQNLRGMWRMSPEAKTRIKKADLVYRPDGIIVAGKDELERLSAGQLDIFSYKEEDILRQDGDIMTGITDIARGTPERNDTATGRSITAGFANERLSLNLDNFADGFNDILDIRHQLYRQFANKREVVMAVGARGQRIINVPLPIIRAKYGFRFVSGRGTAQREVQRTQLLNYLTISAQNPIVAMRTNFDTLTHDILLTFDSLPDPSRYLLAKPQDSVPQEQELLVMMSGVPMPVNPADNHIEHLQTIEEFRQTPEYAEVDDHAKQMIDDHAKEHIPFAQNQAAIMQGTGASGSPMRAQVPGGVTNEADALKAINQQNAPKVRTQ